MPKKRDHLAVVINLEKNALQYHNKIVKYRVATPKNGGTQEIANYYARDFPYLWI